MRCPLLTHLSGAEPVARDIEPSLGRLPRAKGGPNAQPCIIDKRRRIDVLTIQNAACLVSAERHTINTDEPGLPLNTYRTCPIHSDGRDSY